MANVLLCADDPSLSDPSMLGLEGESFEGQCWIQCVANPFFARRVGNEDYELREAWVISCNEIEPINLAAALKHDRPDLAVYLVSASGSGSLTSRVNAATLDGVISLSQFVQRYRHWKGVSTQAVADEPAAMLQENDQPFARTRPIESPSISHSDHRCYLLSVLSASGGVGKSATSCLLGWASHLSGARTLVIDGDLQFGDLDFLMGQPNCVRVDELIDDVTHLSELDSAVNYPLLLGAPRRLERAELVMPHFNDVIELVRERFDSIVINTGSFWSELHLQLLERSTNGLFLIDQRPSSIQSTKHALELCARCGVATNPFLFALNHCSRTGVFTSIDVSCALNGVLVTEFQEGGSAVEEQLSEGRPSELFETANPFALSLASFWAEQATRFITIEDAQVSDLLQSSSRRRSSRRRKRG